MLPSMKHALLWVGLLPACVHRDYLYRHAVSGHVLAPDGTGVVATVTRVEQPGATAVYGLPELYQRTTTADGAFRFEYSGLGGRPEPRMTWYLAAAAQGYETGTRAVELAWSDEEPVGYVLLDVVIELGPSAAATMSEASIGTATMEPDGTLVLQLRAEGPGAMGDALLRYPPSDPRYAEILQHLGGMTPGEEKPVAPFR
jgi:hypothetical protein